MSTPKLRSATFTIPGKPETKGSMVPFIPKGTHIARCKASNRAKLVPWEGRVAQFASGEWEGEPTERPVRVLLNYGLPRPKSHFGTGRNAGKLKPNQPLYPTGRRNDVDKLERAILDGLTGVVFVDDGQVVCVVHNKRFGVAGVKVHVSECWATQEEEDANTEPAQ